MTTTTFGRRSFARWYPRFMDRVERAGQADIRRDQLAHARGRTLEIGAGSGLSVPHYPDQLEELVLLEPNPDLRAQLAARTDTPDVPVRVIDGDAHALDFPDAAFDTVTASLVFCSLRDPARALAEVHRVLRPGGVFLFHEHVRGRRGGRGAGAARARPRRPPPPPRAHPAAHPPGTRRRRGQHPGRGHSPAPDAGLPRRLPARSDLRGAGAR
ncbi:class I SAM-dependent methyltransferase, partial [Nocardia farcinica]|uniref:class I SAM-dependent methyltransferase n=1 Tax=Nocardia farcinica TaxID=37329 RepID=UPI0024584CB9